MPRGIQRIIDLMNAARRSKDVAAVLAPRQFADELVDELYPPVVLRELTGVAAFDRVHEYEYEKRQEERSKYHTLVDDGGYIGTIFGKPMIVAEDVVLCALSKDEVLECASRLGFSAEEVLGKEVECGADGG